MTFGLLWSTLGNCWQCWGHLGVILGGLGGYLGPPWGYLGSCWGYVGYLGASWGFVIINLFTKHKTLTPHGNDKVAFARPLSSEHAPVLNPTPDHVQET